MVTRSGVLNMSADEGMGEQNETVCDDGNMIADVEGEVKLGASEATVSQKEKVGGGDISMAQIALMFSALQNSMVEMMEMNNENKREIEAEINQLKQR